MSAITKQSFAILVVALCISVLIFYLHLVELLICPAAKNAIICSLHTLSYMHI